MTNGISYNVTGCVTPPARIYRQWIATAWVTANITTKSGTEKVIDRVAEAADGRLLCMMRKWYFLAMESERVSLMIITAPCWKCDKPMLVAMAGQSDGPSGFSDEEIALARKHGVILKEVDSATTEESYLANVCGACGAFVGDWFLFTNYWAEAMYGRLDSKTVSN